MTRETIISHWLKGAREAYDAAALLHVAGNYALVLFHCHLAVEKALKAAVIYATDRQPPATHDLILLAKKTSHKWSPADLRTLSALTDYAIRARYDDPAWSESQATKKNCEIWLAKTEKLLKTLFKS
jgi:HEPN domain-containing protein